MNQPTAFSPLDLQPVLWIDAGHVSIIDGQPALTDLTGNGNHLFGGHFPPDSLPDEPHIVD